MAALILAAKAVLAAMLVAAAGAKLADLPAFTAAVRLFGPPQASWRAASAAALGIALAELSLGAASLSCPSAGWLNPLVFAMCCGFVAVSAVGYGLHRGRPCRCFGALSRRRFDAAGIARSAVIMIAAGLAMQPVEPRLVQLPAADRVLLLAGAGLLAVATAAAARALAVSQAAVPEPAAR